MRNQGLQRIFAVAAFAGLTLLSLLQAPGSVAGHVAMPVSFDEVLALPTESPHNVFRYGSAPSQTVALWLPDRESAAAVVVLIHGGCWLHEYAASHTYALAGQLARDGFAVWVPEYRRVGEPGGGWPGTSADVERALARLATVTEPRLDRANVVLAGHSAGGHLALWLASRDGKLLPKGVQLRGAIGIAAITDLARYAAGNNSCEAVTPQFMGGSPAELPQRYADASPAVNPVRVPTILLRGQEDTIVPVEQMQAMGTVGGVVQRALPGAGHFDWLHPDTKAYAMLAEALHDLLDPEP